MEAADKIVERAEAVRLWLQDQLAWAQEEYERYANAHRQPHPEYRVGDQVYVDARHFAAERASKSLGYKNAGPWARYTGYRWQGIRTGATGLYGYGRCLPDLSPVEASPRP